MTDCRRAGHCPSGIRAWFVERDLNFRDFIKNGIDVDTLLSTGDALANQVVARTFGDVGGEEEA